jgi:hypothetical protein
MKPVIHASFASLAHPIADLQIRCVMKARGDHGAPNVRYKPGAGAWAKKKEAPKRLLEITGP